MSTIKLTNAQYAYISDLASDFGYFEDCEYERQVKAAIFVSKAFPGMTPDEAFTAWSKMHAERTRAAKLAADFDKSARNI